MVVTEVMLTGRKLTRTASIDARCVLSMPSRINPRSVSRMWIESATASVRMTIGADIEIGVSLTPKKPAMPMPMVDDSTMITRVATVAESERTMSQVSAKITTNINGISVAPSLIPVSAKGVIKHRYPGQVHLDSRVFGFDLRLRGHARS